MLTLVRSLTRVGAAVLVSAVVLVASPASASSTPETWTDPEPTSALQTILVFVGIPLGLALLLTLMVMVPSLAKGPRYRPGLSWWAEPEWFGGPRDDLEHPALESGAEERSDVDLPGGGASARW